VFDVAKVYTVLVHGQFRGSSKAKSQLCLRQHVMCSFMALEIVEASAYARRRTMNETFLIIEQPGASMNTRTSQCFYRKNLEHVNVVTRQGLWRRVQSPVASAIS
jgi:hypothetical protein